MSTVSVFWGWQLCYVNPVCLRMMAVMRDLRRMTIGKKRRMGSVYVYDLVMRARISCEMLM